MGKGKGKKKGKGNEDQPSEAAPGPSGAGQPSQRQPPQQQTPAPQQQQQQPARQSAQQPARQPAQQQPARQPAQQQPPRQPPQQSRPSQQSGTANEVEIQVPGNKVGLVIGKGGETIKKLQDETGAKMWIVQESRSADSTCKPLRISGDPKKVAEARRRVLDIIGEEQATSAGDSRRQAPQQGASQSSSDRSGSSTPAGAPRPQQPPPQKEAPWAQQQQQTQQGASGPPPQQQPQQGSRSRQPPPQKATPWGQQQRPAAGAPEPQQQPQQRSSGHQQRSQQQGAPPPTRSGPPGFAPAQPPEQHQRPSPDESIATQRLEQMSLGLPAQPAPSRSSPQQASQVQRPSPEKSARGTMVNLGLPQGTKSQDYPQLNSLMPPKRGDRAAMPKQGRRIIVETNHLALSISDPKKTVYHYDVKVDPEKPFRFYRPALRRIREVLYPNNYPSFDGKRNLYSVNKLPFRGDSATETVQIHDEERGVPKDVTVTITLASEVSLASIGEYLREGTSVRPPQDAIQALDIVLRQPAAQRYLQVGRSYFSQPSGTIVQLGDGLNLWYGFFQSAILGWKPYLNIDVAHKGFPAAVNCIAAIEEFYGNRLSPNDRINDWVITKMKSLIKGLKVIYEMPSGHQRRTHKVVDLGRSARDERFTVQDRGEMTVEQYFRETYNYNIRYPLIPCLVCGSQARTFSLPAELCKIVEGQIVLKKLNEIQTRNMVKAAATPAPDRKRKIINSMIGVRFDQDPHIAEFGLRVSKEFKKVDARILNAPTVHYSNKKSVPVNKGVWISSSFIRPGSLSNWVIYNCERRVRPQEMENLEKDLINIGQNLGMSVSQATKMHLKNDNIREVEKDFTTFQKNRVQLLFVILPDRGNVTYAKIKSIAEIQVGVLTQCLKSITIQRRLNAATVTNILLKVNAKINGINHHIDPAYWPSFLERPVMVVGADVTHPSPDQQDIPSVAAVAASHDASAFHYNMKWRLQQPREEMIQDLEQIMIDQLMFFYNRTGYKPEHILFYRDGVSEGQFKKVLDIELQAIRRACKKIGDNYEPPITFLVVQKRHHTRFFPTDPKVADGKNQNVPAGTIVDTEIVHPTEFDFYLVSHASIQGTSRPTKYHVLWDDAKMPEQLLEEITYYLCHLFTRCTRSVSYPAPTYYAHLAAFRIRSYIENQNVRLHNLSQEERNRAVKADIVNNNPMFFV